MQKITSFLFDGVDFGASSGDGANVEIINYGDINTGADYDTFMRIFNIALAMGVRGDKVTIIRREYFPVRKQVKPTEQLIINGTALPYAYSFDGAADITVRAKSESAATVTAVLFR